MNKKSGQSSKKKKENDELRASLVRVLGPSVDHMRFCKRWFRRKMPLFLLFVCGLYTAFKLSAAEPSRFQNHDVIKCD